MLAPFCALNSIACLQYTPVHYRTSHRITSDYTTVHSTLRYTSLHLEFHMCTPNGMRCATSNGVCGRLVFARSLDFSIPPDNYVPCFRSKPDLKSATTCSTRSTRSTRPTRPSNPSFICSTPNTPAQTRTCEKPARHVKNQHGHAGEPTRTPQHGAGLIKVFDVLPTCVPYLFR